MCLSETATVSVENGIKKKKTIFHDNIVNFVNILRVFKNFFHT